MSDDLNDDDFKMEGPLKRYGPMIIAIVIAFLCAPYLNRMLDNYRGVALEVRGDQVLLGLHDRPPEWVEAPNIQAGMMVSKELGSWALAESTPIDTDKPLLDMFKRYSSNWYGTVVKIQPRPNAQAADTAVVKLLDGSEYRFPVWADHLTTIEVGSRLKKLSGGWDPVLMDTEETFPVEFVIPKE